MAPPREPRPELWDGSEQPLVLAGPPFAVQGELRLRNPTAKRVIARQVEIRGVTRKKGKRATSKVPLPGPPIALRRIVLRQSQTRRIPVSLQLDASTPPGTYHAELAVGDGLRETVIHVTEHVSLRITPDDVFLPNRPGETVEKQVVFTNDGNVPVTVPKLGALVLDEDLAHCRALRGALADVGASMETLDDFASALGRQYAQIYETLVLKVENPATTIDAGATVIMKLKVTQPSKLDIRRRYTCFAPIATTSLSFTIAPEA